MKPPLSGRPRSAGWRKPREEGDALMSIYAVTGSASGMGHQVAQKLRDAGHTVIGVDIKQADIVADLSTVEGRRAAAAGVLAASGSRLDGAVLAAGLGPTRAADRARLIAQVNYFGVVDLLDAWRPALAAADRAKVVVSPATPQRQHPRFPRAPCGHSLRTMPRRRFAPPGCSARTLRRSCTPHPRSH